MELPPCYTLPRSWSKTPFAVDPLQGKLSPTAHRPKPPTWHTWHTMGPSHEMGQTPLLRLLLGKNQVTSDLPEYRHLKGKPFDGDLDVDQRTRGLGGLLASCGEENLLRLAVDRYAGRDICVHEFAHSILAHGLSDEVRHRIAAQYRQSTARGLWKSAYAASNDDEFFAGLSMWYFENGDALRKTVTLYGKR
jgi:hypothetical protein